jgi:hypothetical protein
VFCAFSHDYKISPAVFGIWLRLLLRNAGQRAVADVAQ